MLCKEYKNKNRVLMQYKGFRLPSLKLILEYSFPGHLIKIDRNHVQLQFDIYLDKYNKETKAEIDMNELEKFRSFYGPGFNIVLYDFAI